jgi:predicted GNAT superfamily acetyltransferase
LPTDRLVAEWHLDSPRVVDTLSGKVTKNNPRSQRIAVVLDEASPDGVAEVQAQTRNRFQQMFAAGYTVTWFERAPGGGSYILEKQ